MHAAQVLDELMAEADYERVMYLGDGSGDFCPCTKLRPCDYAVTRECYPTGVPHTYLTTVKSDYSHMEYKLTLAIMTRLFGTKLSSHREVALL